MPDAIFKLKESKISDLDYLIDCTSFTAALEIPLMHKDRTPDLVTFFLKQYKDESKLNHIVEHLYYDTPGNLTKYFLALDRANINLSGDKLSCILHLIEKYKNEKNHETLTFLCLFIQKFYNDLCLCNDNNVSSYLFNLSRILNQIDDMRKFNLNEKNILIWIKDILLHEAK